MAYSLDVSQQAIIDYIRSGMPQEIYEVAIPEPETIIRTPGGNVEPYIAFQFGDLSDGYSETFGGARTNDFWLPIYFQTVASEAEVCRKISNRLVHKMLGYQAPYGGETRKRMGGKMLPIGNSDGTVMAYISPASFGVKIQLFDDV